MTDNKLNKKKLISISIIFCITITVFYSLLSYNSDTSLIESDTFVLEEDSLSYPIVLTLIDSQKLPSDSEYIPLSTPLLYEELEYSSVNITDIKDIQSICDSFFESELTIISSNQFSNLNTINSNKHNSVYGFTTAYTYDDRSELNPNTISYAYINDDNNVYLRLNSMDDDKSEESFYLKGSIYEDTINLLPSIYEKYK